MNPTCSFCQNVLKMTKKLKTTCWRNDVFAIPAAVSRTGSKRALLQVLLLHIADAMNNTTHIQDVTLHGTLWLTTAVLAAAATFLLSLQASSYMEPARKESFPPSFVTASHHMRTTGRWRCNTICGRLMGKHGPGLLLFWGFLYLQLFCIFLI